MATTRTTKTRTAGRSRKMAPAAPLRAVTAAKAPSPKGAATASELRRIARAIVTSTSVHDEKRMLALYADSIESQEASQLPVYGIEAMKLKAEQWRKMVADSRWHARNMWCDGQTIIIEWEAQLTLRPGNRKVLLREIAVHEIRAGKIVRERYYYDPSVLR
ncbi:nuclear transport factor 2 family protein [bacterium]|nr:nuclear transport factor 2 family protein [bacterium]